MKPVKATVVLWCSLSVVLLSQQPSDSGPLTNERVMELTRTGVKQQELERLILSAPSVDFHLTPADDDGMLKAGVTEDTIKAMAARESGLGQPMSVVSPAMVSPIASVPVETENHNHKVRRNWIIVGVLAVTAGGLAYTAYRLNNPHSCGPVSSFPHPNPTCN